MTKSRRRQEAFELVQRYEDLAHPEEVGRIGLIVLSNALLTGALQIALLRLYVQMIRRLWRNRQDGARAAVAAASCGPLVLSACFFWCYEVINKVLLLRWARRALERAERETKASQQEPSA